MEPPESLSLIEAVLPNRNMFGAVTNFIPKPIYNRLTGWFGGERNLGIIVAATAATIGVIKVVIYAKKQNRRKKWNAVGKDVVILHTIKRGIHVPCLSPFSLKLETYLKLANIKYEVDFDEPQGPKGKFPWITLNGESIADSQLIIERLEGKFGSHLHTHLTMEQKSVARAMRIMMEEHYAWCYEIWLFFVNGLDSFFKEINFPAGIRLSFFFMTPLIKRKMKKTINAVGIGRHSMQEIQMMGIQDLEALSTWLGNKKFLLGDKPTEVDCAIFGFLAQLVWCFPHSPYGKILTSDYANLEQYCHRMKETIWPDWNAHLDLSQSTTS